MKTINKKNSLLMMAALLAGTMTFGAVGAAQAATPAATSATAIRTLFTFPRSFLITLTLTNKVPKTRVPPLTSCSRR